MPEFATRLWNLILESSSRLTPGEMILRTALICCSIFAAIQLLSMLATHYGDRNATSKSLFLSVLLHCCFGLGWATVLESMPRAPVQTEGEPDESPVQVTLTNDDGHSTELGDNRTIWNVPPQPTSGMMTRMERSEMEPTSVDAPDVDRTPEQTQAPEVADLPTPVEEPKVLPVQESVASTASATPAKMSVELDQPIRDARPEVSANSARRQASREVSSVDLSSQIEPQRGAADRMALPNDEAAGLKLPNEVDSGPAIPKPAGVRDDVIRRRTSPDPIPAEIATTGDNPSSVAATTTGDRKTGRFARVGTPTGADSQLEPAPPSVSQSTSNTSNQSLANDRLIASRASVGSVASETSVQAQRPQIARMDSSPISSRPKATRDPEPYRSRRLEQRRAIALKNGGSIDSERAVEASLKWMASIQEPAGYWSASKYGGGAVKQDPQGNDRMDGGTHADTGITGLVVLSFLGAGYTHEEGKYTDVVTRGLKWLISQQATNGYLGGKATKYDMMYCHSMATFALAEAYCMQSDPSSFPELHEAVQNGVKLICMQQNEDGGWRYGKGGESDMSMFGWQLMALKSAVNAGIPLPEETRRGMTKFLRARALGTNGGLAGYKKTDPPSPAMTAESLYCRQVLGLRLRDGASQESVTYLRQNLPRLSAYDEYYWYYGTLAMFQHDGAPWEEWNGALRDTLVGLQRTQGPQAGSWDPKGKWAGIGGRLYSTAVSTMCLEAYYRFLRIYQTNE